MSNIKGVWVEATVTCTNKDSGHVAMTLKRVDNGTTIMAYDGDRDLFRTGTNFNRPKWGIYRGLFSGIQEARMQIANIQIIK